MQRGGYSNRSRENWTCSLPPLQRLPRATFAYSILTMSKLVAALSKPNDLHDRKGGFSSALTIRVASRRVAPAHKPDPRCDGTPTLMPFTVDGLVQPVASKPVPGSECRTRCPIAASSL